MWRANAGLWRRWLSLLLLLPGLGGLGLLLAAVAPAGAQTTTVPLSSSVDYTFGQAMHFRLRGESDTPVEGATLTWSLQGDGQRHEVPLALLPGRVVSVTYTLHLTDSPLPPFSTVYYQWRLATPAGAVALPLESVAYVDNRVRWQQVTRQGITVHWAEGGPALAETALNVALAAQDRLAQLLPRPDPQPLPIYIYPTTADLRAALRLSGRDRLAGQGGLPALGVVLVAAANPRTAELDLGRDMPREMAYLSLYALAGEQYGMLPAWLREGLAGYAEAVPDPGRAARLAAAQAAGTTLPLAELCASFPAGAEALALADAQSEALVRYILASYGDAALRQLLQSYVAGAGCDAGVAQTLGLSLVDLEAEWLAAARPGETLPANQWQSSALWLILLLAGFGLMALLWLPLRPVAK
ncbi:MAG: hypothetical protein H6666_00765 [Ardenticatenaceae bacterium]|nr:hypothetical protein [Anaerolineales bacterium]MCB8916429.1 hypothetical protein [Ardenticatenaceae bacterium]